mgnify:CR=1 FL=1
MGATRASELERAAAERLRALRESCGGCPAASEVGPYVPVLLALEARGVPAEEFPLDKLVAPQLSARENAFALSAAMSEGLFDRGHASLSEVLAAGLRRAEELGLSDLAARFRRALEEATDVVADFDPVPQWAVDYLAARLQEVARASGASLSLEEARRAARSILLYLSRCGIQPDFAAKYFPAFDVVAVERQAPARSIVSSAESAFRDACGMLSSGRYTYEDVIQHYELLAKGAKGVLQQARYLAVAEFFRQLVAGAPPLAPQAPQAPQRPQRPEAATGLTSEAIEQLARPEMFTHFDVNRVCGAAQMIADAMGGTASASKMIEIFADAVLQNEPKETQCRAWLDALNVFTCFLAQLDPSAASEVYERSLFSEPLPAWGLKKSVFETLKEDAEDMRRVYNAWRAGAVPRSEMEAALQKVAEDMVAASRLMLSRCAG